VILCGPATLLPVKLRVPGMRFEHDLDTLIEEVDVVMPLRIQKERAEGGLIPSLREYRERWGLTAERQTRMRRDALIMHPGPMNPGVEIDPEVAISPQSMIESQVSNGVAIRMALLYLLADREVRRGHGLPRIGAGARVRGPALPFAAARLRAQGDHCQRLTSGGGWRVHDGVLHAEHRAGHRHCGHLAVRPERGRARGSCAGAADRGGDPSAGRQRAD